MKTVRHMRVALAAALLATLVAPSVWACKAPTYPKSIPDGRSADVKGMLEAKQKVEQYLQHVADYTSCEKNALRLQEVLASQNLLMDHYNSEVRKFKQMRSLQVVNRQ